MNALLALATASVLWGTSDFGGTALLARGILTERLKPVQSASVITALAGVLLLSYV